MKTCEWCGKEYDTPGHNSKYCSEKCRRQAYAKKNMKHISDRGKWRNGRWRNNRRITDVIVTVYKGKCAICGWRIANTNDVQHGCEIHHIFPVKDGGTNDYDNLILLCPNCHKEAHAGVLEVKRLKDHQITDAEKAYEEAVNKAIKNCTEAIAKMIFEQKAEDFATNQG